MTFVCGSSKKYLDGQRTHAGVPSHTVHRRKVASSDGSQASQLRLSMKCDCPLCRAPRQWGSRRVRKTCEIGLVRCGELCTRLNIDSVHHFHQVKPKMTWTGRSDNDRLFHARFDRETSRLHFCRIRSFLNHDCFFYLKQTQSNCFLFRKGQRKTTAMKLVIQVWYSERGTIVTERLIQTKALDDWFYYSL